MTEKQAYILWNSILSYAEATGEIQGHGNSGEFHCAKEYIILEKELKVATEELVSDFSTITGWKPTLVSPENAVWHLQKGTKK